MFTYVSVHQARAESATQDQITQNGQISDRFAQAITNLGSNVEDVRVGAVYALQRIMTDSPRDQPAVIEALTAYIRDHTKAADTPQPSPPTDIQAAATVLTTRDTTHDAGTILDLDNTDLANLNLPGAKLANADLSGADLSGANLRDADLTGAYLEGADLACPGLLAKSNPTNMFVCTNLSDAKLVAANFTGSNLMLDSLEDADLTSANLTFAYLYGAYFSDANLTRAAFNGATLSYANFYGANLTQTVLAGAALDHANLFDTGLCAGKVPSNPNRGYKCDPNV